MNKNTKNCFDGQDENSPGGTEVKCLGMAFSSQRRHQYFLEELRQKLKPTVPRAIQGFPWARTRTYLPSPILPTTPLVRILG